MKFILTYLLVQLLLSTSAFADAMNHMAGMTEAHNAIRLRLGIQQLKWSNELAEFAQEWADFLASEKQCHLEHRPLTGKYAQKYGENLYWASSIQFSNGKKEIQQISASKVVSSWAGESRDYDYIRNTCKQGKTCGHYTQVVWNKTTQLGCGMAFCEDKSQIWVCNYYPPGNITGEKPW